MSDYILRVKRDTAANWAANNPTLQLGRIGWDRTNKRFAIGDGSTAWNSFAEADFFNAGELEVTQNITNNFNTTSGGNMTALSGYAGDLPDAIADIGATETTLLIDTDYTVSSAIVIPDNIRLMPANGAKFTESGTGSIEFEGVGLVDPLSQVPLFSGFEAGDVTWTGTVWPKQISTELWDTGNDSLTDRVARADAAFSGKQVQMVAYPRTVTDSTRITQYHAMHFTPGVYDSELDTWGGGAGSKLAAFLLDSDTHITGSNLAYLNESPNESCCQWFYAYPMRNGGNFTDVVENIIVEGLNFTGNEAASDPSGQLCVIHLGNCHNSFIRFCRFDRTHGYGALMGGFGTAGTFAYNSAIHHNLFIGCGSQNADVLNGKHCHIVFNKFDQTLSNNEATYAVIDLEPNTYDCTLEQIFVEDNTIDVTNEIDDASKFCNAIAVQGTNGNAKNIFVRRNTIIGREISVTPGGLATGIQAFGVEELVVEDNYIRGAASAGYQIQNCRFGKIKNNSGIWLGDAVGNLAGMYLSGVAGMVVAGNEFPTVSGDAHAKKIYENELDFPVTSSGTGITNLEPTNAQFRFYEFWAVAGFTVSLNGSEYTVDSVTDHEDMTMTASVGTLAVATVPSASDVDTGANTITETGHNYQNGMKLQYIAGSVAIGGLTSFAKYFVVNRTADTFQLALTLGGSAIDLTSTGTGNQTFRPIMMTRFSNNTYRDNSADDVVTEPTGDSVVYSRATDLVKRGTVTIDPASVNATTVASQTFTLTGAATGDSLVINPPAAGLTAGLLVLQTFVSAANQITIVFYNTTGSPIDQASASWTYQLSRGT